jgi:HK97 family phage prohead protease
MKYKLNDRIDLTVKASLLSVPKIENENIDGIDIKDGLTYGEIEVIVSNSGTDRYGETITMEGIDVSEVRRNPVVLWAHDYTGLPIGKITKLWRSNGNLLARIKLDYDIYDFADMVYKMILRGTINAVSIGGMIKEFAKADDGATDYSKIAKLEMVELSVVPVGAHPDALVVSKSLGVDQKEFQEKFDQFLYKSLVDKYQNKPDNIRDSINALKSLTSVLESAYKTDPVETQAPKKETIKKYVVTRKVAKQVDIQAEMLIKAITDKLKKEA